jgi:hypothetical protein
MFGTSIVHTPVASVVQVLVTPALTVVTSTPDRTPWHVDETVNWMWNAVLGAVQQERHTFISAVLPSRGQVPVIPASITATFHAVTDHVNEPP